VLSAEGLERFEAEADRRVREELRRRREAEQPV